MDSSQKTIIGLALGSGLARGWAHVGVLKALRDFGIEPDVIAGTSMGAIVGGVGLAGKLDELETWGRSLSTLSLLRQFDLTMGAGGLISGDRLTGQLEELVGAARFNALPKPFACVATNLLSGHEVWLRRGRLVDAMRASMSLPGMFKPVKVGGRWLVDGALVNPVPVSVCHAMGAQVVIAVNVNADLIGRKRNQLPDSSAAQLAAALENSENGNGTAGKLLRQVFSPVRDNLTMFGVMAESLNIILDRIARSRLAGEPADVVIAPRVGHIGMMEFQRAGEIIEEGYLATQRALESIGDAMLMLGSEEDNAGNDEA